MNFIKRCTIVWKENAITVKCSEAKLRVAKVCNSKRLQLQQPKTIRRRTFSGAAKGTKTHALALLLAAYWQPTPKSVRQVQVWLGFAISKD